MVRIRQFIKKIVVRQKKRIVDWSPDLAGNPQRKAVCLKVTVRKPKKPNSAKRRIAKIDLKMYDNTRRYIWVYVPGEGCNIDKHSLVMIRGGRVPDLPGVRYHVIRGVCSTMGVKGRKRGRSKYGTKDPKAQLRRNRKLKIKGSPVVKKVKISLPRWDYPMLLPVPKFKIHNKNNRKQ